MIRKSIILLAFLAITFSCKKEKAKTEFSEKKHSKIEVTSLDYNQLKPYLERTDDKTYVVNFWATWCAPSVKELPYFEKINKAYANQNVEVLLVSLDFPKQVDKKLIPFIKKRNLQSEVVLLDDTNENVWIPSINENWSGALPATLIYNKNNRKFYEQSFTYEALENELKTFINP